MKKTKRAFISYSHEDQGIAEQIANELRKNGIDAWIDIFEILPGDSLIQKIFDEGLANADVFIILLTKNSTNSKWVKEELSFATIRRIEGITRIIPIKIGDIEIPNPLKGLLYLNMELDIRSELPKLLNAINETRTKPKLIIPEDSFINNPFSEYGFSKLATSLSLLLLHTGNFDNGNEESFSEDELANRLNFSPEETDDAIDELARCGFIKTFDHFGTAPYSHGEIEATYALFIKQEESVLGYSPFEDIKLLMAEIASNHECDGNKLLNLTKLPPLRINRAIAYIEDNGLANVVHTLGTAPFDFRYVDATYITRRFVEERCK
jgi:hypothetical protein